MTNPNHTDTSRSGDLVERLRKARVWPDYSQSRVTIETAHEAADCIEALEAEIERLASFIMHFIEGEPSQSQGAVDTAIRVMTEQATTIGEQLAEIERLRYHLEGTLETLLDAEVCSTDCVHCNAARAALGEKP